MEGYRYVLGSVLSQVLLHQSIIGEETKAALKKIVKKAVKPLKKAVTKKAAVRI